MKPEAEREREFTFFDQPRNPELDAELSVLLKAAPPSGGQVTPFMRACGLATVQLIHDKHDEKFNFDDELSTVFIAMDIARHLSISIDDPRLPYFASRISGFAIVCASQPAYELQ